MQFIQVAKAKVKGDIVELGRFENWKPFTKMNSDERDKHRKWIEGVTQKAEAMDADIIKTELSTSRILLDLEQA